VGIGLYKKVTIILRNYCNLSIISLNFRESGPWTGMFEPKTGEFNPKNTSNGSRPY